VALDPDFFSAAANLARRDMADKDVKSAKKSYATMIEIDKKSVTAMGALTALELSQRRNNEATIWQEKTQSENSDAIGPTLALARHYLSVKQTEKALALMRKTFTVHPANPAVLDAMGQVQVANKDLNGALESYSKLTATVP